jgi:hypothetical protein
VKPLTRIICLQDYTKDFTCTKISSFDQLIWITAWSRRFLHNCRM